MTLTHTLERTITIEASPETVFRYFTDSARWASWWGAGSSIDAFPGGAVKIRHANGVEVSGQVLEMVEGQQIVFTYGYESGVPIPPGGSLVKIVLRPVEGGTQLSLTHAFADEGVRDHHIQGWRFQLSLFGNTVSNEIHANAAEMVDGWFAAWTIADDAQRNRALANVASPDVKFRDRYSLLEGADDVSAHIAAALRFMPGIVVERRGKVRQCQGVAITEWAALSADGVERMTGTNVFQLGSDGKITAATGILNV
ncbi:MAG TPA: SRPBCC domain-containing protein [Bryobacteraceae bacterium]|nr:SRPBCC domain-containing protein [Bryobacteraceae bacterium]